MEEVEITPEGAGPAQENASVKVEREEPAPSAEPHPPEAAPSQDPAAAQPDAASETSNPGESTAEHAPPSEAAPPEEQLATQAAPTETSTEQAVEEPSETVPSEDPQAQSAEPLPDPAADASATDESEPPASDLVSMAEFLATETSSTDSVPIQVSIDDVQLRAVLEAIVYVSEEPLTLAQLAAALQQPSTRIQAMIGELIAEFEKPEHGVTIREVAGGYKMATKAEHHDAVRSFVKSLKPPLKLSLPALETLAVIAYKQPVTSPEIMEIRGVKGGGVLNTLLDRKLIAAAGRKNVIGKPILYKTTKEFLIQFGLKDLSELPSLKEFEEIRRMAFADSEPEPPSPADTQPGQQQPAQAVDAPVEAPDPSELPPQES
jgi:segregation and condensation protein B